MIAADFLEGKSLSEHVQQGGRMFCVDYVAGELQLPAAAAFLQSTLHAYQCVVLI